MRWTILPFALTLTLAFAACSDDDVELDSGATPDQKVVVDQSLSDQILVDQKTGSDQKVTDAPAKKKVHEYLPKGTEVTGWSEDVAAGAAGPDSGYTKTAIEALINGKHDPYHVEGCDAFAREQYKKTFTATCSAAAEIMIWECPTAVAAKKMHDKNKAAASSLTWTTIAGVTAEGLVADDSPLWRGLGYKTVYVYKMDATATDSPCFTTLKADVESFVKVLAGNLP
jgi:hypothetical protein